MRLRRGPNRDHSRRYTAAELAAIAERIGPGDEDLDDEFHDETAARRLLDLHQHQTPPIR
jgi:hypothetical protein